MASFSCDTLLWKINTGIFRFDSTFQGFLRHLSTTNAFLRNKWNDGQVLIKKTSGGHSVADTSLKRTSFLGPYSHSIFLTYLKRTRPITAHLKVFLLTNLYASYFRKCFTVSFKFSLIFVIFLNNLMAFSSL